MDLILRVHNEYDILPVETCGDIVVYLADSSPTLRAIYYQLHTYVLPQKRKLLITEKCILSVWFYEKAIQLLNVGTKVSFCCQRRFGEGFETAGPGHIVKLEPLAAS